MSDSVVPMNPWFELPSETEIPRLIFDLQFQAQFNQLYLSINYCTIILDFSNDF